MVARNVFFDLDGTLIDSLPGIEYSVDRALASFGFSRRVDLQPLIGPPIRRILAAVAPRGITERTVDELEAAFRSSYDGEGWQRTVLYDGARDMLEALASRGVALFVVTNKPVRPTHRILETFGIYSLLVKMLCRDSVSPPFPSKTEMVRQLLIFCGDAAEDCVLVGDTREDSQAAGEAGIRFILAGHGYGELANDWPIYARVSHLSEITCMV